MKLKNYLKDLIYIPTLGLILLTVLVLFMSALKINKLVIILTIIMFSIFIITILLIGYFRKRNFYNTLLANIEELDKSYLVEETLETPNFYEGKLIMDALYRIDKSFIESINELKEHNKDFKNYIEMWIHEVKIPISALILFAHNNKIKNKNVITEINKIDELVEQILFYARSETANDDYLIKKTSLKKVINNVALKNKDLLLENNIEFIVEDVNTTVLTDAKWLEFILNQIINNSIKYHKSDNPFIKISVSTEPETTKLRVLDNGIGIPSEDLPKVFNKSFTGSNGRNGTKSTGMGLFIVKNLCEKLGLNLTLESKQNEFTEITITFYKNSIFDCLK